LLAVPCQVQYATDLINSNWTNVGSVIMGTGASNAVCDTSVPALRKVYRVLSIQ
jgi:hypothetical protein